MQPTLNLRYAKKKRHVHPAKETPKTPTAGPKTITLNNFLTQNNVNRTIQGDLFNKLPLEYIQYYKPPTKNKRKERPKSTYLRP